MDVLAAGYPSLDTIMPVSHSPAVGETALVRSLPEGVSYGGCGANIAVALATLGFHPGVAMVLGTDAAGDDYVRYLEARGVDTGNVERLAGAQSSRCYLFLNPEGQYQTFFFPGAADAWQGDLVLHDLAGCRYALVTVGAYHYNWQVVQRVRQAGIPLVWVLRADSAAYPPATLRDFLAASAYVLMNHIEAAYLAQALGLGAVEECLGGTTRALVVTQGKDGSRVYTAEGAAAIPAVAPRRDVDPTGAGDGFAAGFVAGLLRGAGPQVCARLGAVLASFVLEQVGCQTNLPTWEQVTERYRETFGKSGELDGGFNPVS